MIACKDITVLESIKAQFSDRFDMVDFGQAASILGIRITRDFAAGTLYLDQSDYSDNILKRFHHDQSSGASAPLSTEKHYSRDMCPITDL